MIIAVVILCILSGGNARAPSKSRNFCAAPKLPKDKRLPIVEPVDGIKVDQEDFGYYGSIKIPNKTVQNIKYGANYCRTVSSKMLCNPVEDENMVLYDHRTVVPGVDYRHTRQIPYISEKSDSDTINENLEKYIRNLNFGTTKLVQHDIKWIESAFENEINICSSDLKKSYFIQEYTTLKRLYLQRNDIEEFLKKAELWVECEKQ